MAKKIDKDKRIDLKKEDSFLVIEGLAREGLHNYEIAEEIGYNQNYFSSLVKKNKKISEALERGRKPLTFLVENAYLRLALGQTEKVTTKIKYHKTPKGDITKIEEEVIREKIPPNARACINWLKAKGGDAWQIAFNPIAAKEAILELLEDAENRKEEKASKGKKGKASFVMIDAEDLTQSQIDKYLGVDTSDDDDNDDVDE